MTFPAGIPLASLANSRTGCYVGCMTNDYEMLSLRDIYDLPQTAASATSEAMTANRVSWFFGLKGPSLTLDTACSSSLYALHLACQSLKLRETNMVGYKIYFNLLSLYELTDLFQTVAGCRCKSYHVPEHNAPALGNAHVEPRRNFTHV